MLEKWMGFMILTEEKTFIMPVTVVDAQDSSGLCKNDMMLEFTNLELLHAVLTCTPFDPSNHTEKINNAFLENQEKYHPFEVAATFDMGNGYTITACVRVKAPTVEELDTYRRWLAEEDAQFPYNFSAVWDQLETEFANNG